MTQDTPNNPGCVIMVYSPLLTAAGNWVICQADSTSSTLGTEES